VGSATATAVARAARQCRGDFTAADVRERLEIDTTARTVRRHLATLADAGYLGRDETATGVANEYTDAEAPGAGDATLPSVAGGATDTPDDSPQYVSYTWSVRVAGGNEGDSGLREPGRVTIPAPQTATGEIGDGPPGS